MLDDALLQLTTRQHFIPVLRNNVYNKTRLLKILSKNGRVRQWTGRGLLWDVVKEMHGSVGLFSGYSTIPNQPNNPLASASLPNANYVAAIAVSLEEEELNKGKPEKLLDIVKVQTENAESTLRNRLGTDLYGTGALVGGKQPIIGLGGAVTGTTGVYAGLNRATAGNEFWRANVNSTAHTQANMKDSTHASYLPAIMRTMMTDCTFDGSPDVIATTKKIYNIYQDIAQTTNLRFDNDVADLGFPTVKFEGVTMMFDDFCTTGYMYYLNSSTWTMWIIRDFDFDTRSGSMWKLPVDQLAKVAHLLWMGQLRLDTPRENGVLSSLALT